MHHNDYWSKVLDARISRRRAVAASGGVAFGTALLAACGGNDGTDGKQASSDITKPADTSKQAVRGGTMKTYSSADISSYDVHNTQQGGQTIPGLAYSRFVVIEPGYLAPTDYQVMGDMGESWEFSPDGLTLTMKLRQGAGWAPLSPVNGRPVDIEDIAYTWKRWAAQGSNRADHLNSLNPDGPVLSFATPDARTFVWKLAYPTTVFLLLIAGGPKTPYIIPKEAESKYDLRTGPIGSGQFYVSEYGTSVGWTLKRNPNYYDKAHPYIETIERPIVPEYAAAAAQFRVGGIYDFPEVRQEDVLTLKAEAPELNMYQLPPGRGGAGGSARYAFFGWKPNPPERTPFRDVRVRQAYSRAMDRDTWISAWYNVPALEAAGIPVETRWNTFLSPGFDSWLLDPRSKDFGPNAVNFQHDVAEAKKLLAAAGFPNGVEVNSAWPVTGFGADFGKWFTSIEGMAQEVGFRFKTSNPEFTNEYRLNYRDARGNFEGISYRNAGLVGGDPVNNLASLYMSTEGNINFGGFDPAGKGDFSGDPTLEAWISSAKREPDVNKQKAIVKDIQRYLGKMLYTILTPGNASTFELLWPVVRNHGVYNEDSRRYYYYWIDEKQAPLKRA